MYCWITLSSGAVQYLWNVYATFASKGLPKTEKFPSHCAPQETEYGGHQSFGSRPSTSCRAVQARDSAVLASENAGSAHSASHNQAPPAHRDSASPSVSR